MSSAGLVAISPFRGDSLMFYPTLPADSHESLFVYLAMPGSMAPNREPMRVLGSESIESVKFRIQTCKGVVVKNQKLICGGRELSRSNSLVRDYGVCEGNVLHLVLRLSELQAIVVRTSSGEEYSFQIERSKEVGCVKKQIAESRDCSEDDDDVEDAEVLCDGERVEDQKLINDLCKNGADAVIHLFVRQSAMVKSRPLETSVEMTFLAGSAKLSDDEESEYEDVVVDDENCEYRNGVLVVEEVEESFFVPRKPPDRAVVLEPFIVNPKIELPLAVLDMIDSTFEGLEMGGCPVRSSEGTGGAYFMLDGSQSKYLSVFKPMDEEPLAENNPRGLPVSLDGEGLKKGTRVGEGALRECAAYILDHPSSGRRSYTNDVEGFAGVPPTFLVKCLHEGFNHPDGVKMKIGSLQAFVENDGSCEDRGPNAFPVNEVHKIAVLDMRMANADRHAGNILVGKGEDGQTVLIPIDHGYCLPESFEDCTFDWQYWPQALQPFSPETLDYIDKMDVESDIALLKFYGWELPLEVARVFRISTMLLKMGAQRGLTPFAISSIMCRKNLNNPSAIEDIIQEALDMVLPGCSEDAFLECVACVIERHLDKIA